MGAMGPMATPIVCSRAGRVSLPARNNDMAEKRMSGRIAEAVTRTDQGGAFISSIVAGLILGYLLDRWLGTGPWLTIGLSLVGAYSGFMRAWHYAKTQGARDDEERKQRGR